MLQKTRCWNSLQISLLLQRKLLLVIVLPLLLVHLAMFKVRQKPHELLNLSVIVIKTYTT